MARVLVVEPIHQCGLDILRRRSGIVVEQLGQTNEAAVAAGARQADAILIRTCRLSAEAIEGARQLKVVSRHGVGYDNIDLAALNARRIPLTVVGAVNAVSVAEHTFFLMLTAVKRGLAYDRAVREGRWSLRNSLGARELDGKTLLIVGLGRIGRNVAAKAQAFGMHVIAYDPLLNQAPAGSGVELADDLDQALAKADVVSLHVPMTASTRMLFDAGRLGRMKVSAVLICTARGGLVDETALAAALKEGRLAAAGLDVFAEEPAPPNHPLYALDNVVLSPHSAALTEECAARMSAVSAQNCLDALDGRLDPSLVVNPDVLGARP
jgi:D-3-phosphoglycerate dehydrogenase